MNYFCPTDAHELMHVPSRGGVENERQVRALADGKTVVSLNGGVEPPTSGIKSQFGADGATTHTTTPLWRLDAEARMAVYMNLYC